MLPTGRFPQLEIKRLCELRAWLHANHAQVEAVWLVTWMRSVPERSRSVASCVLWLNLQMRWDGW